MDSSFVKLDTTGLDQIFQLIQDELQLIREEVADIVVKEEQDNVVVATGLTKSTIKKIDNPDGTITVSVGEGIPDQRVLLIEYGGVNRPAHPFVGPAIEKGQTAYVSKLEHLQDRIKAKFRKR